MSFVQEASKISGLRLIEPLKHEKAATCVPALCCSVCVWCNSLLGCYRRQGSQIGPQSSVGLYILAILLTQRKPHSKTPALVQTCPLAKTVGKTRSKYDLRVLKASEVDSKQKEENVQLRLVLGGEKDQSKRRMRNIVELRHEQ